MREALGALTTRGRAFLAAGLTAGVSAVAVGQTDLLRVAGLLLALPLLAAAVVARRRQRISLERHLLPDRIAVGGESAVALVVSNTSRRRTGTLLLEDQVPFVLGVRPRFLLEGMAGNERHELAYAVHPELRGRYELGPLRVRVDDPFGMVRLTRTFHSTAQLTVTPPVTPLPAIALPGGSSGTGDRRTRSFAVGSAEDHTVRDYRRGDDLRRVHWRSSARLGELMVRREEQPWEARATILLDDRAGAHRGAGAGSSFEAGVRVAASVGCHLADAGYAVGLVTATGSRHGTSSHAAHDRGRAGDTHALLDTLAVLDTSPAPHWEGSWLDDTGAGGVLVAVLGHVTDDDRRLLARLRRHAGVALAVVLDTPAWHHGRTDQAPSGQVLADWLATQGWRTTTLGPRDRLSETWRALGDPLAAARGGGRR